MKKATTAKTNPLSIVGVGASAGGLEALRAFFGSFKKAPSSMSFVVVQHLSPQHRSRLVELIAHSTALEVKEIQNSTRIDPGVVYITPPNKDAILDGDRIKLKAPHFKIGPKPSVDLFLKSLAASVGDRGIAVILSGTGSDGAHGVRDVKAAGGMVFCQTSSSAKYDGMPRAALQTGAVDFELAPENMAKALLKLVKQLPGSRSAPVVKGTDPYFEILSYVKVHCGVGFEKYKQNTIRRRIERRMVATGTHNLPQYLKYLRSHDEEPALLYQDILISVTSFFRDGDFFRTLSRELFKRLKDKKSTSSFRAWVIGCATGEEAFSLAIEIHECLEKLNRNMTVQIFATDIDEQALAIARRGIYSSASLLDVPKPLQEKYFSVVDDRLQVKPIVRDSVIFAKHDVIENPPFLNLDLVSCRNVLIYFNNSLQQKVFQTAHYALDREGILFLGKSENVPNEPAYFVAIDKSTKLYSRTEVKGELPRSSHRAESLRDSKNTPKERTKALHSTENGDLLIKAIAPDSILISQEMQILHVFGKAGGFLNVPQGQATTALNRLVPTDFGFELSTLVQRCQKTSQPAMGLRREIKIHKKLISLQVRVTRMPSQDGVRFLVIFDSAEVDKKSKKSVVAGKKSPQEVSELRQELRSTRENLQTIIEEQETSGEELQSLNEELQSANEELQSSNEELETANEELQSSNEELTTLNEEINVKSAELNTANLRLTAIQNAIVYPLVVVDCKLQVVSFNPAARYLLRLGDHDHGIHIRSAPTNLDLRTPIDALQNSIKKGVDARIQFKANDRSFEVQIQPVRNEKSELEGAVMSFVENTEIVNSLEQNRGVRARLTDILDNTPAMVTMKDPTGVFVYANRRFCDLLETTSDNIVGKTAEELFGAETGALIREKDFEVIKKREAIQTDELVRLGSKTFWWASSKFPLLDLKRKVQSVCTISLDVTSRVSHEQQLELFKKAVSTAGTGIVIFEWAAKSLRTSYISEHLTNQFNISDTADITVEKLLPKIFPKLRVSAIEALADSLKAGKSFSKSINVAGEDAADSWVELRSFPLQFDQSAKYVVISVVDTTQQIQDQKLIATQQDELSKFNRYSAIGEISAGIAHEINTPLNVISTKTDLVRMMNQRNKLDGDKLVRVASDIDSMVKNISEIVLGLKSLTGENSDRFEKVNVPTLINDTLRICEFRLQRAGVTLKTRLPDGDLLIRAIPVQISQILINLVNNSIDALKDNRDRWIEVEAQEKRNGIDIIVTDAGSGIDENLSEKIMTPFFTTKKDSKGTGIGLSLSRSIARRHGGDLVLDREHTHTSFVLSLPKYTKDIAAQSIESNIYDS